MPKRPYDWRVDTHGCYKLDSATLGLGPRDQTAHLPVVNKRNKEGLSADITNTSVCGDDVLDCDVADQNHVSAHLFPSVSITCESLGASCFAPH